MNFDIESFYPSITENLFHFAKDIVVISNTELSIVLQARKILLSHVDIPWVKRSGNEEFDVPMGLYYGVEVCELVGCRSFEKYSPASEKKRKEIVKVIKHYMIFQ